jgi:hypothetical protein
MVEIKSIVVSHGNFGTADEDLKWQIFSHWFILCRNF